MKKNNWLAIAIIPAIFVADKWENFVIESSTEYVEVEVEIEKGPAQEHEWVTYDNHHYTFGSPHFSNSIGTPERSWLPSYPSYTFASVQFLVRNDADLTMFYHDEFFLRCERTEFGESDRGMDVMMIDGLLDTNILDKGEDAEGVLVFEVPEFFEHCENLTLNASKSIVEFENER